MRAEKRTSLREIARICNLSPTTVSRIAKGIGSFSEETRRLVLDTMAREGYAIESSAVTQQKPIVGCLVADFSNELFADRLQEMETYFREKNMVFIARETRRDAELEAETAQQFYRMGAVGLIVTPATRELTCGPLPIPVVYTDRHAEDSDDPLAASVASDDFVGGQLAAQELLHKGCTKPLILNIRHVAYWNNSRIQGFLHDFEEQGIKIDTDRILQSDVNKSSFDSAKDLIAYHWTKGTEFDSVFACSDWRAYGALVALRNMGVKVPEDVKIVGYDGIRVSRYCDVPITTIQQNTQMLSQTVCDTLWNLMQNGHAEHRHVLIPIRLQEGKTT